MDCSRVIGKLSSYVDGVLEEHDLGIVEAHLAQCDGCRRELATLTALIQAAGRIDQAAPPPGLKRRILRSASELQQKEQACARVSSLLSSYIDGEVTPKEKRAVAAHLGDCESCKMQFEALETLVGAANSIDPTAPPVNLRARIAAATTEGIARRPFACLLREVASTGALRWAAGAAAAAFVALALISSFSETPRQVRQAARPHRPAASVAVTPAPAVPAPSRTVVRIQPAPPERLSSALIARHTARHTSRRTSKALALLPSVKASPARLAPKHPAKPVTSPAEEAKAGPEAPPVDTLARTEAAAVAAVPAPAPAAKPAPKKPGEPALARVATAGIFAEDAKEFVKRIKSEAAMRKGSGQTVVVQIVGSRF